MALPEEKSVAVLTIKDAGKMSAKGRNEIAAWLRHCADSLVKDGHNYSRRFRARYLVR